MSNFTGRRVSLPLSVSQNFLTSAATIRRLLGLTSITPDDRVIEIGPGRGHITRELLGVCRRVDAYELDPALFDKLQSRFTGAGNLHLYNRDFLNVQLPSDDAYKVFANIPFNLTSEIIRKLTTAVNPPVEAWLVLEKGAAKRFMGLPAETGASLQIKPFFDLETLYHFQREDFHPAPSVDAVLLHISRKAECDVLPTERRAYADFIARCQKYGVEAVLSRRQITAALRQAGLPCIPRSATLLYVQWLCLFRCWRQCGR